MNRTTIDVKTEVRKLASSKPVHAAAGAGVLASAALRELPARIARWRSDGSLAALPGIATEYMTTARTKAVQEYDKLATHGARVLNGKTALPGKGAAGKKS
ncbi:MAG: hypothetical protein ACRDND_24405 [Streptosporangiaceae bacterium]